METSFEAYWKKRAQEIAGYASKPGARYWFNLGRQCGKKDLQRAWQANQTRELKKIKSLGENSGK